MPRTADTTRSLTVAVEHQYRKYYETDRFMPFQREKLTRWGEKNNNNCRCRTVICALHGLLSELLPRIHIRTTEENEIIMKYI